MKSTEYPDLEWVAAKSFSPGRPERIRVIVVHTTEGHEDQRSAENGAHNDAVRTDGTSAHYFHDPDSTVQCVLTRDRAHSARAHGNMIGIHHELCGTAEQSASQWADAASQGIIRNAARQAARDAAKYGIPIRRLTSAEVRNGALGFCGHNEITSAFPEDRGTHWDPGTAFPWPLFLSLVEQYTNGEDDMPTPNEVAEAVWAAEVGPAANRVKMSALLARAATPQPAPTVVLAPDQLDALADKVAAKLAGGFELAFRPVA
jgi:hypothetical protein